LIKVFWGSVGKARGLPRGVPYSHKNVACHTDHGHGVAVFGKLVWQQGKKMHSAFVGRQTVQHGP